jgi:hypothetical protein
MSSLKEGAAGAVETNPMRTELCGRKAKPITDATSIDLRKKEKTVQAIVF